jgi:hypothetical protein
VQVHWPLNNAQVFHVEVQVQIKQQQENMEKSEDNACVNCSYNSYLSDSRVSSFSLLDAGEHPPCGTSLFSVL